MSQAKHFTSSPNSPSDNRGRLLVPRRRHGSANNPRIRNAFLFWRRVLNPASYCRRTSSEAWSGELVSSRGLDPLHTYITHISVSLAARFFLAKCNGRYPIFIRDHPDPKMIPFPVAPVKRNQLEIACSCHPPADEAPSPRQVRRQSAKWTSCGCRRSAF